MRFVWWQSLAPKADARRMVSLVLLREIVQSSQDTFYESILLSSKVNPVFIEILFSSISDARVRTASLNCWIRFEGDS
jgi:hypothetical protein